MTLLKTASQVVEQALEDFKVYTNGYDEPESFQDVVEYDDEVETIMCLRITENRDGLESSAYYYSVDVVVTDNDDVVEAKSYYPNENSALGLEKLIYEVCEIDWSNN